MPHSADSFIPRPFRLSLAVVKKHGFVYNANTSNWQPQIKRGIHIPADSATAETGQSGSENTADLEPQFYNISQGAPTGCTWKDPATAAGL